MKKNSFQWLVRLESGTVYGPFKNAADAATWACKAFDTSIRWSIVRIHEAF